jgi:LmbE family N-acetylglucosaminyl deacetylase
MKALVVVAHSDDHVLWMGGTIRRLNRWVWHILSLCKSHDSEDFKPKRLMFDQSCRQLGATRYAAKDLPDYQAREAMGCHQLMRMRKEILAFADNAYDLVFTHSMSDNCEYSFHANHAEVRDAVDELLKSPMIRTEGILHFSYRSGGRERPVIADLDTADYQIELTPREIAAKTRLKRSFIWAEADLQSLNLWDNDEPKMEAFQAASLKLELPSDFAKMRSSEAGGSHPAK